MGYQLEFHDHYFSKQTRKKNKLKDHFTSRKLINVITNTILALVDILPPLIRLNQAGVFSPRELEDNVVECHRGRNGERKLCVGIINVDAESRKEFHFKNLKRP